MNTKTFLSIRLIAVLAGVVLPAWGISAAGCLAEDSSHGAELVGDGPGTSTGDPGGCIGPDCEDSCEANPRPGCPCDVEGQHLLCGKVEENLDGQEVCGKGFSVCTDGTWDDCIINNAVTLVPDAPPGFYVQSLGQGTSCASNPCDPACVDFVDTPDGLADAGTSIKTNDAGITLAGDGGSVCVPRTCADQGKNCGPAGDGCGGLLQCGTCTSPNTCGGAGVASVCGVPSSCTNLCLKQTTCSGGATTSVTGTVYLPNGIEPLPNAVVYVPNAAVTAFAAGVTCDNCSTVSGSPLVSTTTAVDGTFTLGNMPVGSNIPLVIQIGRWRRQIVIPSVTACKNTTIATTLTRLPRNKSEGDIPKMAFVTGAVDAMECVWRKIGMADSEFTNPTGSGRIHFYAGGQNPGTYIKKIGSTGTPVESTLLSSPATLSQYDMILFPCQGAQYSYAAATQLAYSNNIADYVNAGGRMFATHYSYIWLYRDNVKFFSPLAPAVNWSLNQAVPTPDPQTGFIDTSFPKGAQLAQWLKLVGASTTLGQIPIDTLRRDFTSVNAPSQRWMYVNKPTAAIPQHLTFNTPLGVPAANQCGRVVFSDFHVENSDDANYEFPTECSGGAMTAQERLLAFMLFDLASCVQPDQGPACTPTTCSAQGLNCGPAGDGCGGTLSCGSCASPTTCGGGGQSGVCGTPSVYNTDGSFVRDYDASACPAGTAPVWRLWSWSSVTPSDTRIEFKVQTASTKAGLSSAPMDAVLFSNPPGPAALTNQNTSAHQANVPAGAPDTQLGSASIDYTLQKKGRTRNLDHLRITAQLFASTDKLKAPTLSSWDLQISCADSE